MLDGLAIAVNEPFERCLSIRQRCVAISAFEFGLVTILNAETKALSPICACGERKIRRGSSVESTWRDLGRVDGKIDLFSGSDNIRPIEEGVADRRADPGGQLPAHRETDFAHGTEFIPIVNPTVRSLDE